MDSRWTSKQSHAFCAFYMLEYYRSLMDLMDLIRAWLTQLHDGKVVHASAVQEYVYLYA